MTIGASAGIGRSCTRCPTGITKRNAKSRTARANAIFRLAMAKAMITGARAVANVGVTITTARATEKIAIKGTVAVKAVARAKEMEATKATSTRARAKARTVTKAMTTAKAVARAVKAKAMMTTMGKAEVKEGRTTTTMVGRAEIKEKAPERTTMTAKRPPKVKVSNG